MRSRSLVVIGASVPLMTGSAVLVGSPAMSAADVTITLTEIREIRIIDLQPADEDEFGFMSDTPGLVLSFDITLPAGERLLDIGQPEDITASDSIGTDLTDIEEGFSGEREYISIEEMYSFDEEDPEKSLSMHLSLPARRAETFSVRAVAAATTYTGTDTVEVDLTSDWVDLDPSVFGEGARVRLGKAFGESGVEFVPADIESRFETVEVVVGENILEAQGWMSDNRSITYMFDSLDPNQPARVRLAVRTGLQTRDIVFELKNQKLP